MDTMRNDLFVEDDRDGLAVERPADHAHFPGLEVAATNSAHGMTAAGSLANQVSAAPLSSDPLDAYFRNLDHYALLSRDEEFALAMRIDEAQTALLVGLCRIPLIIERVGGWADDVREGRLRLNYLLDAVPSDEREAAEDELSDDGRLDVSAEAMDLTPRLELVAVLSGEIAGLARKRMAALARGK
ncbi:MAG TPA: sigma-70 factor domain-containing protein, partial [Methyloceanibacter sp.]|nr:sigma-70 factor domain-containing protein [Methyloceanibacter sp.]